MRHGQDVNAPPFEDVIQGFLDNPEAERTKEVNRWARAGFPFPDPFLPWAHPPQVMHTAAFCLQWANIQLKYFCGYQTTCRDLPDGGAKAYQIASSNLRRHFLVVVVVEKVRPLSKLVSVFCCPKYEKETPTIFCY